MNPLSLYQENAFHLRTSPSSWYLRLYLGWANADSVNLEMTTQRFRISIRTSIRRHAELPFFGGTGPCYNDNIAVIHLTQTLPSLTECKEHRYHG